MTRSDGRRVLVVDDEPKVLAFLEMLLEDAEFQVTTAADGPEALSLLDKQTFGVAVIDKNLSAHMSGIDVLREARQMQPYLQVLIHTGYPSTESAVEALKAGAFDYVQKPTDNQLLVAQVERAWLTHELSASRDELLRDYERLFEIIPGIVWFTNAEGTLRKVSTTGASLLGYEPMDLVGEHYKILLDASEQNEHAHEVFTERRAGERAGGRKLVTLKTRTGDKRVFEVSSSATYKNHHSEKQKAYRGTLAVGWDLTESLRMFNELLAARQMNDLGRLAGGVAHDFNNLLTVILNSAAFGLSTVAQDHAAVEHLTLILEAANAASDMTRTLMTFSRHNEMATAQVDMASVLEGVRDATNRLIREPVHVDFSQEPHLWKVFADASQIQQLIVNLALNAQAAMPEGGPLMIRVYNRVGDSGDGAAPAAPLGGDCVVIEVIDKGVGMSPEVQKRAFDPFFTTKPVGEGTGLGLAMVHGVASRCGGRAEIDSAIGTGTTVRVYLPRAAKTPQRAEPAPQPAAAGGKETILLVEDNVLLRKVARRILQVAGYAVAEAGDTESALRVWAETGSVDAVLTDVIMPGRSGIQLADELRSSDPKLPIVLMSGHVGNLEQMTPMDERTAFIQKPFKADQLLAALRRVLDYRSPS